MSIIAPSPDLNKSDTWKAVVCLLAGAILGLILCKFMLPQPYGYWIGQWGLFGWVISAFVPRPELFFAPAFGPHYFISRILFKVVTGRS